MTITREDLEKTFETLENYCKRPNLTLEEWRQAMLTTPKPWGEEELLVSVPGKYAVKKLTMFQTKRCSLQYHEKKTETVIVIEGAILYSEYRASKKEIKKLGWETFVSHAEKNLVERILKPRDLVTIFPYTVHRMKGLENRNVYYECSTTELLDVVRLADDYLRKRRGGNKPMSDNEKERYAVRFVKDEEYEGIDYSEMSVNGGKVVYWGSLFNCEAYIRLLNIYNS